MKKTNFVWMAALIIALVMVASACKNGGDGIPGLPGTKKPGDVQNFDGSPVTNKTDAANLLTAALSSSYFTSVLSLAQTEAYNAAFNDKYTDWFSFALENAAKTSYSYSVSINDSEKLKDKANAALYGTGNVTAATIKGKQSGSWSSNEFLAVAVVNNVGDWISNSSSTDLTFDISKGFYKSTVSSPFSGTIQVAGIITVKSDSNSKSTYITEPSLTEAEKITTNGSTSKRIAATLSISDGTKGGKFVFSGSRDTNTKQRAAGTSSGSNYSDIEVYDNSGNKICTFTNTSLLNSLLSSF